MFICGILVFVEKRREKTNFIKFLNFWLKIPHDISKNYENIQLTRRHHHEKTEESFLKLVSINSGQK